MVVVCKKPSVLRLVSVILHKDFLGKTAVSILCESRQFPQKLVCEQSEQIMLF